MSETYDSLMIGIGNDGRNDDGDYARDTNQQGGQRQSGIVFGKRVGLRLGKP